MSRKNILTDKSNSPLFRHLLDLKNTSYSPKKSNKSSNMDDKINNPIISKSSTTVKQNIVSKNGSSSFPQGREEDIDSTKTLPNSQLTAATLPDFDIKGPLSSSTPLKTKETERISTTDVHQNYVIPALKSTDLFEVQNAILMVDNWYQSAKPLIDKLLSVNQSLFGTESEQYKKVKAKADNRLLAFSHWTRQLKRHSQHITGQDADTMTEADIHSISAEERSDVLEDPKDDTQDNSINNFDNLDDSADKPTATLSPDNKTVRNVIQSTQKTFSIEEPHQMNTATELNPQKAIPLSPMSSRFNVFKEQLANILSERITENIEPIQEMVKKSFTHFGELYMDLQSINETNLKQLVHPFLNDSRLIVQKYSEMKEQNEISLNNFDLKVKTLTDISFELNAKLMSIQSREQELQKEIHSFEEKLDSTTSLLNKRSETVEDILTDAQSGISAYVNKSETRMKYIEERFQRLQDTCYAIQAESKKLSVDSINKYTEAYEFHSSKIDSLITTVDQLKCSLENALKDESITNPNEIQDLIDLTSETNNNRPQQSRQTKPKVFDPVIKNVSREELDRQEQRKEFAKRFPLPPELQELLGKLPDEHLRNFAMHANNSWEHQLKSQHFSQQQHNTSQFSRLPSYASNDKKDSDDQNLSFAIQCRPPEKQR